MIWRTSEDLKITLGFYVERPAHYGAVRRATVGHLLRAIRPNSTYYPILERAVINTVGRLLLSESPACFSHTTCNLAPRLKVNYRAAREIALMTAESNGHSIGQDTPPRPLKAGHMRATFSSDVHHTGFSMLTAVRPNLATLDIGALESGENAI